MLTAKLNRPTACRRIRRDEANIARQRASACSSRNRLGPRQEELLSYLQGLAPVGEGFLLLRAEVIADLGFGADAVFYRALRKLIRAGCVARLETGRSHVSGRYKVLSRVEAISLAEFEPPLPGRADPNQERASDVETTPERPSAREPCPAVEPRSKTVSSSIPMRRKRP